MTLNPAHWRQRRADLRVQSQPGLGLQSEFQDIPGYTEKERKGEKESKASGTYIVRLTLSQIITIINELIN